MAHLCCPTTDSRRSKVPFKPFKKDNGTNTGTNEIRKYIEGHYSEYVKACANAFKTLDNRVGIVFIIPELNVMSNKKVSDNLAVYTGTVSYSTRSKLEVKLKKVFVDSDSSSALTSIKYMQSATRHDIVLDIAQTVFRIKRSGIEIKFM